MSNSKKPLTAKCFNCLKSLTVKYVRATHTYSQKNHWGYWTGAEENRGYYVCDQCLFRLYHNYKWEFRRMIPNKKKQVLLRQYILSGVIKGKIEPIFNKIKNEEIRVRVDAEHQPKRKKVWRKNNFHKGIN
ncbi:protein of unknown function [endosymbiont DhMRE of Dentiscutata heterogama]|uniref:hypothetical protein n=1 Tax=endosymbiont DhMRE of Dentiscutata heterogama TaxID=1609546 RepID=UPI000629D43C|nr:hypothetical protein [endosymbiont DhMRE of Dentiscutata heterogama]CFW93019.1 protein of unknown function [endosymbiont DhMRE of Dentiscutata heterogama]